MSLPTDLHREIAERVPQPGFDVVVDRASAARRRRRTVLAAGLATAVVVTGVAWSVAGPDGGGRSPEPAAPLPSSASGDLSSVDPRLPADVREVLDAARVDVFDVSATDDGAVGVLWAACDGATGAPSEGCRNALVVQDGDEVHGLVLDGDPRAITPVPGGWLVQEAPGPVVVDASGERRPIVETGSGTTRAEAGDTAVVVGGQWRLLRGDKLIDVPVPLDDPTTLLGAYVTPGGLLAVAVDNAVTGFEVVVSDDGGASWSAGLLRVADVGPASTRGPRDVVQGLVLAGRGEDLAVVAVGDVPGSGSIPVVDVRTSHDGGASWNETLGLGFGSQEDGWMRPVDLSAVTVTTTGTTYLTTASHHVVRIDPEGNALTVQLSSFDRSVFAVGEGACVLSEAGLRDRLRCSDDDGTSWRDRALPGLR